MTRDDGTMAITLTALIAIVAVLTTAVAALGILYGARAHATNASDAAALAAAVATYPPAASASPSAVAQLVARANGAMLLSCRCELDSSLSSRTVMVTTGVETEVPIFGRVTVRVSSRAEFDPVRWLGD
jgi:hypothetical protein